MHIHVPGAPVPLSYFYPILVILTGNIYMHLTLRLYKFEFLPDRTIDYEVSCPLASKISMSHFFLGFYSDPF